MRSHVGALSSEHPYDLSITLSFIIRGNWSSERLKFAPKSCHYWRTEVKFKQRLAHDALTHIIKINYYFNILATMHSCNINFNCYKGNQLIFVSELNRILKN